MSCWPLPHRASLIRFHPGGLPIPAAWVNQSSDGDRRRGLALRRARLSARRDLAAADPLNKALPELKLPSTSN